MFSLSKDIGIALGTTNTLVYMKVASSGQGHPHQGTCHLLFDAKSWGAQEISKMITEIINAETGNDFVAFELKGISDIALQRKYKGRMQRV